MVAETAPGSFGHEIHASLDCRPEDVRTLKLRYSALIPESTDPDVEPLLRERGIDTVVITGTLTNVCCESTARDAMMRDFKTVFVADANATRSDAEHNATLVSLLQVFADVRSTSEVVDLLSAGAGESGAAVDPESPAAGHPSPGPGD